MVARNHSVDQIEEASGEDADAADDEPAGREGRGRESETSAPDDRQQIRIRPTA